MRFQSVGPWRPGWGGQFIRTRRRLGRWASAIAAIGAILAILAFSGLADPYGDYLKILCFPLLALAVMLMVVRLDRSRDRHR